MIWDIDQSGISERMKTLERTTDGVVLLDNGEIDIWSTIPARLHTWIFTSGKPTAAWQMWRLLLQSFSHFLAANFRENNCKTLSEQDQYHNGKTLRWNYSDRRVDEYKPNSRTDGVLKHWAHLHVINPACMLGILIELTSTSHMFWYHVNTVGLYF